MSFYDIAERVLHVQGVDMTDFIIDYGFYSDVKTRSVKSITYQMNVCKQGIRAGSFKYINARLVRMLHARAEKHQLSDDLLTELEYLLMSNKRFVLMSNVIRVAQKELWGISGFSAEHWLAQDCEDRTHFISRKKLMKMDEERLDELRYEIASIGNLTPAGLAAKLSIPQMRFTRMFRANTMHIVNGELRKLLRYCISRGRLDLAKEYVHLLLCGIANMRDFVEMWPHFITIDYDVRRLILTVSRMPE